LPRFNSKTQLFELKSISIELRLIACTAGIDLRSIAWRTRISSYITQLKLSRSVLKLRLRPMPPTTQLQLLLIGRS
jgi:hypothetical protein